MYFQRCYSKKRAEKVAERELNYQTFQVSNGDAVQVGFARFASITSRIGFISFSGSLWRGSALTSSSCASSTPGKWLPLRNRKGNRMLYLENLWKYSRMISVGAKPTLFLLWVAYTPATISTDRGLSKWLNHIRSISNCISPALGLKKHLSDLTIWIYMYFWGSYPSIYIICICTHTCHEPTENTYELLTFQGP